MTFLSATGLYQSHRWVNRLIGVAGLCFVCVSPVNAAAERLSAKELVEQAERELAAASKNVGHAMWLSSTYINHDSQLLSAKAMKEYTLLSVSYAKMAAAYEGQSLDPVTRRKLNRLKQDLDLPAPTNAESAGELADIGLQMESMYGEGKYCNDKRCYTLGEMEEVMAHSRDPVLLKELWIGWRTVSPPMRKLYERQVVIGNAGAQELGYQDLSDLWRSKYDMHPDAFAADMDRQWDKVKPLYSALQCHVRAKLSDFYGDTVVTPEGKIPAQLLGNMWAQTWGNVYDLVKPNPVLPPGGLPINDPQDSDPQDNESLDQKIKASGMSERDMVKTGEAFFTSLGFDPLPQTFWERSQFVKPRDREVICHASAWNVDDEDDLRIKMCIQKNAEDFQTIHHELGHNFYQRAYNQLPYLLKGSANDGFHEALGDTIALSITPSYLKKLNLIEREPPVAEDLDYLMKMALNKIAFLPFGLLVDKWRWQVFSGELAPEDYNKGWWALREAYQGIEPPVERTEADFDPGAKYHIPGNTPYSRYFLAFIQQFQFHRALCNQIGFDGPLHRCSIYGSKTAGDKLNAMMAMGASQPWPDALEVLTGQRELDASAINDYFAPLLVWLDEQNKNRQCGW